MLDNLLNKISDSKVVDFLITSLEQTQEKSEQGGILFLLQGARHCITKKQEQQLRGLLIDNFEKYKENALGLLLLCEKMNLFNDNSKTITILRKVYDENLLGENNFAVVARIIEKYGLADDLSDLVAKSFEEEFFHNSTSNWEYIRECFYFFTKADSIRKVNKVLLGNDENSYNSNINFFKHDKLKKFINTLADSYIQTPDDELFKEVVNLALALSRYFIYNNHRIVVSFFTLINKVEDYYQYVVDLDIQDNHDKINLLIFPSDTMVELCANGFSDGTLNQKYLTYYHNNLPDKEKKLFAILVNKKIDNFFEKAEVDLQNQESIVKKYTLKQFEMLVDADLLTEELKRVFELTYENRKNKSIESITKNDLFDRDERKRLGITAHSLWIEKFGARIINKYILSDIKGFDTLNREKLYSTLSIWTKEHKEFIGLNELTQNYDINRHQEYKTTLLPKIQSWCNNNTPLLDLDNADKYYSGVAQVVKELYKEDLAQISDATLLNLLQFDTVETEFYIKIADKVGLENVITRIKENMSNPRKDKLLALNLGLLGGYYANFLIERVTKKADKNEFANLFYEWLLVTKNKEYNYFTRNCINLIIDFQPNSNSLLESLLEEMVIREDWLDKEAKKQLIDELVKRKSPRVKNYLLEIFESEEGVSFVKSNVADQLAFLGEENAWGYIVENLEAYQQVKEHTYFNPFWFISDFDFANGEFMVYLQKMFAYMINQYSYGGLYDTYMNAYLNYAYQSEENYQSLLTHIEGCLSHASNNNVSSFLSSFKRQYAEQQAINIKIEDLLVDFE